MIRQQMNARAASEVQGDEHMITDEKAMKYVRKLKKYCSEHECNNCIFDNVMKKYKCPIQNSIMELERIDGKSL